MKRMRALLVLALLLWLPLQGVAQTVLPVQALLESAILAAAPDLHPDARLEFVLPEGAPSEARRLIAVEHDFRQAAFAAIAETLDGAQITFRGKVYALIDVPMPNRPILPGEIVQTQDFSLRALPLTALGRYTVTDLASLEGQEVRRTLPEGRPIQSQSLQTARVIKRGEKLTLYYANGPLEVTAPARAMEDAGLGQALRVQNLNSSKTVTGIALGDGRVQVSQ